MLIDMDRMRKVLATALDRYGDYAPSCERISGRRFRVGEKYEVDLNGYTCTCKDYTYRGHTGPCKHLVVAFIYDYAMIHEEPEVH